MINSLLLSANIMSSFLNVQITRVIDADTFVVQLPKSPDVFGRDISVRIKGINTPEVRTKKICEKKDGTKAKEILEELLLGGVTNLHFCERDKFFRILCVPIVSDTINAGDFMIAQGYAVPYFGETKKPWKCKR